MAQANSGMFATPEGQLAFADSLFEKRSQDGVKFNYGCTLIFDEKHRPFFEDIIRRVVGLKWGEKGQRDYRRRPYQKPAARRRRPTGAFTGQSGNCGLAWDRANSSSGPTPMRMPSRRYSGAPSAIQANREDIYSGCWGKGILNAYSWENPSGGRGVSFGIRAFQKHRDGESLGGRAPFDPDKWIVDLEDADTVNPFN